MNLIKRAQLKVSVSASTDKKSLGKLKTEKLWTIGHVAPGADRFFRADAESADASCEAAD